MIYRGKGWGCLVVPIAGALLLFGASALFDFLDGRGFLHVQPVAIFFVASIVGIGLYCLGAHLERRRRRSDKDSSEIEIRMADSFLYLGIRYWGALFIVLSLVWMVLDLGSRWLNGRPLIQP